MEMDNKIKASKSRSQNAKLNIIYGYIAQIGILILSFVGRKIFLNYLSADHLGINGLYSNILSVLSLAELGLDTSLVYSLYKPVAQNDNVLIHSLLSYFKKIYYFLALIIFVIGIAIIPFLDLLIKSDISYKDLVCFYILFLINSVASYLVAYKLALLSAAQEQRIQKLITLSFNLVLQILHILVLCLFRNYYAYVLSTIINTILTNIVFSIVTKKLHPQVFKEKQIVDFDKKQITSRIISTFFYKIGAVLINSTDNILISALVSTIAVGYYANYNTVVMAITGFISVITSSLIAGIGNLAAEKSGKNQCKLFDMMLLFYHCISAIGLIGFSLVFNDFITIWLGTQYLFDKETVIIISINFYLSNAISPVWMFREANGLFGKVKYLLLIRAFINIALSVFLGRIMGVFGILFATTISLLLTNFWVEPRILFKDVFDRPVFLYWKKQIKYFITTCICFCICYFCVFRTESMSILFVAINGLIILFITLLIFILSNLRNEEFIQLKKYIVRK